MSLAACAGTTGGQGECSDNGDGGKCGGEGRDDGGGEGGGEGGSGERGARREVEGWSEWRRQL